MNSILKKTITSLKYIFVVLAVGIWIVSFFANDNVFASELPSIELNTTKEDAEETQEVQQSIENDKKDMMPYIVIGVVSVVAVISIVINVIFISNKKKEQEYKNQIDKLKSKYKNNGAGEKIENHDNQKQSGVNQKYTGDVSSTAMLWKVVIQLFDKTNSILYETSFDSSKENVDIKLGRGDKTKVDIKVPLPNISDEHCLILKRGNMYYLKDLNSTNGTKYNEEKVTNTDVINHNGKLHLGRSEFELVILDKQK